jgi:hypothetical protein
VLLALLLMPGSLRGLFHPIVQMVLAEMAASRAS